MRIAQSSAARSAPRLTARDEPAHADLVRHPQAEASPGNGARVTSSLVELRVLEGPNLYFPRAAIKLTLDIARLAAVPTRPRPGSPGGSA